MRHVSETRECDMCLRDVVETRETSGKVHATFYFLIETQVFFLVGKQYDEKQETMAYVITSLILCFNCCFARKKKLTQD